MADKRLFLLDAYALIFRAYYALIRMPRTTQAGFNTSAIFGFVNTLEELLRKEAPTHIAVCFDPPGPTFRNEAFDEYKGERSATPEDIKLSVPVIKEIVRAYNIPIVEVEGFEADDVIGTLARCAEKEGFTVYMMTPDKDFGQLVSPSVFQYKPSYRGQDFELRGEEEVCGRYGIERASQVIDLLALMGDKVDNIPGCPGVGEKTAVKLIRDFGSVENLLDNTGHLKGALRKKVEENAENIRFSKFLATIRTDVPVDVDPGSLEARPADREKLFAIFKDLEFKSLVARVARRLDSAKVRPVPEAGLFDFVDGGDVSGNEGEEAPHSHPAPEAVPENYVTVSDDVALGELKRALDGAERIGIHLAADGENDAMSGFTGAALATAPGKAWYVPAGYTDGVRFLLDLMAMPALVKVSCNAKRDMVLAARLRNDEIDALVNYRDIFLAHYVLQPEMRHSADVLAQTYLGWEIPVAPARSPRKARSLFEDDDTSGENMRAACIQADAALRLIVPLEEEVRRQGMERLLDDIELPLVRVLAGMELAGVRLDVAALNDAARDMEERIAALEEEIYSLVGERFNIGSPAKVGEVLFDRLKLDAKARKTKTGQYSTSEDILEKLVPKHPVVGKIMEFRALRKLLTTYLQALPAAINPETGKVHTNYNQTVTATGRISSSAPNLQNIPVRDDEGREIRRAFIADPGCLFFSADYSQIELRLMADFSDDGIMLDAFRNGRDIHAITAARIFHKSPEEVTANERRKAKTANFGIIYGISAFGLSTRLGIPRAEAKEIIDNYFMTFPGVKKYMSDSVEHAREKGYVETRMGRRRMLPDINSKNPVVRGYAERNAINAPLQGTAADIIKVAMVAIEREMRKLGLKSTMIMQVHDELNFNVIPEELPVLQELVTRQMESAYSGKVPLTAESGVASNWLDAH